MTYFVVNKNTSTINFITSLCNYVYEINITNKHIRTCFYNYFHKINNTKHNLTFFYKGAQTQSTVPDLVQKFLSTYVVVWSGTSFKKTSLFLRK